MDGEPQTPIIPLEVEIRNKFEAKRKVMSPMDAFTSALAEWGHERIELAGQQIVNRGEIIPYDNDEAFKKLGAEAPDGFAAIYYGNAAHCIKESLATEQINIIDFNNAMVDSIHSKYIFWNSEYTADPDTKLSPEEVIKLLQTAGKGPALTEFFKGEMEDMPVNLRNILLAQKDIIQQFLPTIEQLYGNIAAPRQTVKTH